MATLTAAQAATTAGVTIGTIYTWARMGAVKATKAARRWAIDSASLAKRIALGIRHTTKKAKTIEYTTENMIAIGGNEWKRGNYHRVYFNNWHELAGLELEHYGTGNIRWAGWQGETVSNSQGYKLAGSVEKVWFDAATGKFHCRYGFTESRVASQREVFDAVVAGIRARIAAL